MPRLMFHAKFDSDNPNWNRNPEINRFYLQSQERYANHLLNDRGHVFLNDVHDILGIPRTREGQVVGWIVPDNGQSRTISFGVDETKITSKTTSIPLRFYVDGDILAALDAA